MNVHEHNRLKWLAAALCVACIITIAFQLAYLLEKRSTPYVATTGMNTPPAKNPTVLPTPEKYISELGELKKVASSWPKLPYPGPSDWLSQYHEEEQTVKALIRSSTLRAKNRSIGIAIQPIHPLDDEVNDSIPELDRFMEIIFQCPVRLMPTLETPKDFYFREGRQINASRLLNWLVSKRPDDVWSTAGILSHDMSTPDMNFVFGLSSLTEGVNITSTVRFSDANPKVTLGRICCTMAHELGHALGITHCVAYSCMLNGCNHLAESDSRPKLFCPHCVAKLKALRGLDPMKYYAESEAFFARHGMEKDRELARQALIALKAD